MQIDMNIKTDMECDTDMDIVFMLKVHMYEILKLVFHIFLDHSIKDKTEV
jgi:hypothetical protein